MDIDLTNEKIYAMHMAYDKIEDQMQDMTYKLLGGLAYLHGAGIVHRGAGTAPRRPPPPAPKKFWER